MTFVLAGFSPGLSAAEYNYSGNSPVITKSVSGSENLKITYSNGTLTGTANGIGATSVSGDIEVANGGIINVSGPNGIYAYSSSGGDVYLENTGSITTSGTYGVGLTATKTGNIEVLTLTARASRARATAFMPPPSLAISRSPISVPQGQPVGLRHLCLYCRED